ncbi:hypothetical protein KJ359_012395 [Pestalotiopsis sp. 9143b]|nr:hypothetical protein KJ359_012395 [Pestalotiopsis sp. 9143b]
MASKSDRTPVPDPAEQDAFFPSKYSLSQYVSPKTDFDGADYPNAYTGDKWKPGGEYFSAANHPVEMLLPMLHLDAAGFDIDIATVSGDSVKFEVWAFPKEDEAYKNKIRKPLKLEEVWGNGFTKETPYVGVFIPGGHGILNDVPASATVGKILRWALDNQRYYISLCHGPASMLAADVGNGPGTKSIFEQVLTSSFEKGRDTPVTAVGSPSGDIV